MTFVKMPKRDGLCSKFISALVLQTFLFSNIAFATPAVKESAPADLIRQDEIVATPEKIVIPRECGMVKSKYVGNSGKLIIHIQDAHCNYEAQSNIVTILENLIRNYNLSLVSVEGADGLIDTSWFKAFPDEEVRKEVATYFMKKGEITGPEFLSITTDYHIKLFGAETRSYYIQNLNAFTTSYPLKEETEKYYNQIKTVLNRLKSIIYSDELKAFDAKMQDYESKKLPFNEYVRFLEAEAQKLKVNLREYENFFKLISALIYEKKIDFNITDKERAALIDDLSKRLPKETLTELVSRSLAFKVGKISSVEYYDYLKSLAAGNKIDITKQYPNLSNYIIYNAVYSKIENEKLFNDMKALEIALKERMFKNDDQRTLDKLSRHVEILLGLINIKLLNNDFEYFKAHKEEFAHEVFADFIKKKTAQYGLAYDVTIPSDTVVSSTSKLEDFYAIALKRDKALVDNTLNEMKKERLKLGVLITGGFHSDGITRLLEKQGISYMVVCPSITKDVPSPYIQILTNQRTPFEDILATATDAKGGMVGTMYITKLIEIARDPKALAEISQGAGEVEGKSLETRLAAVKAEAAVIAPLAGKALERFGPPTVTFEKDRDEYYRQIMARVIAIYAREHQIGLDMLLRAVEPDQRAAVKKAAEALLKTAAEQDRRTAKAAEEKRPGRTTPGTQAGAKRALTGVEEASKIDNMLKDSFERGEARVLGDENPKMKWVHQQLGQRFNFVTHSRLIERIDDYNERIPLEQGKLPYLVHPGRGPGHDLLQGHIDGYLYNNLTKEELLVLAQHELAHLFIHNVEEMYENKYDMDEYIRPRCGEGAVLIWSQWRTARKPQGEEQEKFVNFVLGYNVTKIVHRMEALAAEKHKVSERKQQSLGWLKRNLGDLKEIVAGSKGPKELIVITNGKDGPLVKKDLEESENTILRNDGDVTVLANEEPKRRGQFFGLLDAIRNWKERVGKGLNVDDVSIGGMMPGHGTRLAPFTQRLFGIKPFAPMLIRTSLESDKWLNGAEASIYTWNLVAYHMKKGGFRGMLWKWNDEPQLAAVDMDTIDKMDLSDVDFVRFGSEVVITEDLANNKEWLIVGPDGTVRQVRRRPRTELLERLGIEDTEGAKAMVHIGSPAFSYLFLEKAEEVFGKLSGWMDVDGYLCEALTQDSATWEAEYNREMRIAVQNVLEGYCVSGEMIDILTVAKKINCKKEDIFSTWEQLVVEGLVKYEKETGEYKAECGKRDPKKMSDEERDRLRFKEPGMHEAGRVLKEMSFQTDMRPGHTIFYEKCQELKEKIEKKRGSPLKIKVINFGEDLYWGDIGQLAKARESLHLVAEAGPEGEFARALACIDHIERDSYGNIIVEIKGGKKCVYPKDGSVRNSVLINTNIYGKVEIDNAVLVNSDIGYARIKTGSVVFGSVVADLMMGERGFSFGSIAEHLEIPADGAHTSIPKNLDDISQGLEDWRADQKVDVGSEEYYKKIKFGNPATFETLQERMRARPQGMDIDKIDAGIDQLFAKPVRDGLCLMPERMKGPELAFGTSGLRGTDAELTDKECYINTRGFLEYLINLPEDKGGIKKGGYVALAGDFRPSTPRILKAVAAAIIDSGCKVDYQGKIPTPAVAYYAMPKRRASIMVTGSHIPFGLNGIKFNKANGELLKHEEKPMLEQARSIRARVYAQSEEEYMFNNKAAFKQAAALAEKKTKTLAEAEETTAAAAAKAEAADMYIGRYVDFFGSEALKGKNILVWQQSSVGRDILVEILERLGANAIPVGALPEGQFQPIDTERMTREVLKKLKEYARDYKTKPAAEYGNKTMEQQFGGLFAIVSADGDADRPVFCDEEGEFLPGDKLGVLASIRLRPDFVAIPKTANSDALKKLKMIGARVETTDVGSPYVIQAMYEEMEEARSSGRESRTLSYEVNGGFLTGTDWVREGRTLKALPTRDAALPMIETLLLASEGSEGFKINPGSKVSELFKIFSRHTKSDLVDIHTPGCERYKKEMGKPLIKSLSPQNEDIEEVDYKKMTITYKKGKGGTVPLVHETPLAYHLLAIKDKFKEYFSGFDNELGEIVSINFLTGIRITFEKGDIVHLRPSGNAAEFRFQPEASSQERADHLAELRTQVLPRIIGEYIREEEKARAEAEKEKMPMRPVYLVPTALPRTTPGIYAAATEAPLSGIQQQVAGAIFGGSVNAANAGNIAANLFAVLKSASSNESEYLPALEGILNAVLEKYPTMTPQQKTAAEEFYKSVAKEALKVKDVNVAKGLQIMVGQAIIISTLIENEIPEAAGYRVTTNRSEMVKGYTKEPFTSANERAPSYLKAPAGVEVSFLEGWKGLHHRGSEGVAKLGKSALRGVGIPENKEMLERTVLYVMLHHKGFHTTVFLHKMVPGTLQYASTGNGHYQGTMIDIKQVVKGSVMQALEIYDKEGEKAGMLEHIILEGQYGLALPVTVDHMIPMSELVVFNDISVEAPESEIGRLNEFMTGVPAASIKAEGALGGKISQQVGERGASYTLVEVAGQEYPRFMRVDSEGPKSTWGTGIVSGGMMPSIFENSYGVKSLADLWRRIAPEGKLDEAEKNKIVANLPAEMAPAVELLATEPEEMLLEAQFAKAAEVIMPLTNAINIAASHAEMLEEIRKAQRAATHGIGFAVTPALLAYANENVEQLRTLYKATMELTGEPADRNIAYFIRILQLVMFRQSGLSPAAVQVPTAWGAETWRLFGDMRQPKEYLSPIPGTEVRIGSVTLREMNLAELFEAAPEIAGENFAVSPFFSKILETNFQPFVHVGFAKEMNREEFGNLLKKEQELMKGLLESLKEGITEAEFAQFKELYGAWAIAQATFKNAAERWTSPETGTKLLPFISEAKKTEFPSLMQEIAKTRHAIVSNLNEVNLAELEEGQAILCRTDTPHSIFGLSLQIHGAPAARGVEKNEAWIITKKDGKIVLEEPQQVSTTTLSIADFYRPLEWREGKVQMRKKITDADIDNWLANNINFRPTPLNEIVLTPKPAALPQGSRGVEREVLIGEANLGGVDWPYFAAERLRFAAQGGEIALPATTTGSVTELSVTSGKITVRIGEFPPIELKEGETYVVSAENKQPVVISAAAGAEARLLTPAVQETLKANVAAPSEQGSTELNLTSAGTTSERVRVKTEVPADKWLGGRGGVVIAEKGRLGIFKEGKEIAVVPEGESYPIESLEGITFRKLSEGEVTAKVEYAPTEEEAPVFAALEALRANLINGVVHARMKDKKGIQIQMSEALARALYRAGDPKTAGHSKAEMGEVLKFINAYLREYYKTYLEGDIVITTVDWNDAASLTRTKREGYVPVGWVTNTELNTMTDKTVINTMNIVPISQERVVNMLAAGKGWFYVRELEAVSVILACTTPDDIEKRTSISFDLLRVMNTMIDKRITSVADLKPLLPIGKDGTPEARINMLIKQLLITRPMMPYDTRSELAGRRQVLWSV